MARANLIQPCQHSSVPVDEEVYRDDPGPCMGARDERCDHRPGMCACFDAPPTQGTKGKGFDMRPHGAHAYALSR